MYAIAIVRYRRPLEEVLKIVEAHRTYLRELKRKGWLLASGFFCCACRTNRPALISIGCGTAIRSFRRERPNTRSGPGCRTSGKMISIGRERPGPAPHDPNGRAARARRTDFMLA